MKFRRANKKEDGSFKKKTHTLKRKIYIGTAVVLTAVFAGGGIFLKLKSEQKPSGIEKTVQATEAQAELGSISNTIVGTGNLETGTAVSLKIPSGITVSQLKVESGDHVSKGDVLAEVDKTSVYTAMEEVQESISALDEQIAELQEKSEEDTIDAPVDGRVKKIYITENGDVSDCMLENSALLLLSIDGKMAVDLEKTNTELAKGDTVTVTLTTGIQTEGTVEEQKGSTYTITITDSGVGMGDTAQITDADGNAVGSGITYIHQPLEITGTMGTVTEIHVSEDEAVDSGDTLFTLEADSRTAEYESLHGQREALSETLTELLTLSKEGNITADMDGTIEEIYVSEEERETENSQASSASVQASNMSYTVSSGVRDSKKGMDFYSGTGLLRLSAQTNAQETITDGATETVIVSDTTASEDGQSSEGEEPSEGEGSSEGEEPQFEEQTPQKQTLYFSVNDTLSGNAESLGIVVPRTGSSPQTQIISTDNSYYGSISWNPGDNPFLPGVTYQAAVTLTAGEGYSFAADSITQAAAGVISGISISEDGSLLTFTLTFPETQAADSEEGKEDSTEQNQESSAETESSQAADKNQSESDNSQLSSEKQTNAENIQNSSTAAGQTGSSGAGTGNQGGSGAGAASGGGQTATASEQSEDSVEGTSSQYSTDTTAFTIAGDESMRLSVSVDELDINSVSLDQKAEITFDAIEDKTFEGTVTKVGSTASASGGVAKYTVEITVPKSEEMKAGMNASATIVIEEKENIVTIPVNALQERGEEVFVYTGQSEDGQLTGEQQVETGISDGEKVEITEGLSEGDVVYYQKTGGQNSSSAGGMGENMEMPSGGMGMERMENPGGSGNAGGGMGGGMGTPPER